MAIFWKIAVMQCYQIGFLVENAKIKTFKCDNFENFQTMWNEFNFVTLKMEEENSKISFGINVDAANLLRSFDDDFQDPKNVKPIDFLWFPEFT